MTLNVIDTKVSSALHQRMLHYEECDLQKNEQSLYTHACCNGKDVQSCHCCPGETRCYMLEDIQQHMSSIEPMDLGAFSKLIWMKCIHACRPAVIQALQVQQGSTTAAEMALQNLEGHGRQSERCRMGTPNTCLSAKLASQSCSVSLDLSVTHALPNSSAGGRHPCL